MSSRLMRIGRNSSSPQPWVTTADASSRRTSWPCSLSTSTTVMPCSPGSAFTRVTPWMAEKAGATSAPGACICRNIVSLPRRRAVRLAGVSTATTLPLAMITMRWQVCDTSGRMCVLSTTEWLPPRSLMSCRDSMICFGSRPAVGSSSTSTSGLWMSA